MKKKEERKIANFKELYASLKQNLKDVSNEIFRVSGKIESGNKEVEDIRKVIKAENFKLKDLAISSAEELKKVESAKEGLNVLEELLANNITSHNKNVEEFEQLKQKGLAKLEKTKISINTLLDKEKNLKHNIQDLKNLEKTKKFVLVEIDHLRGILSDEEKKIDKCEKDIQIKLESFEKNKSILEKQMKKLDEEIDKKQKSSLSFKANMKAIEKRLKIREKDLRIHGNRIKKAYADLGKEIVFQEIEIPTFKQK